MATVMPNLITGEMLFQMPQPADGAQQELIEGVIITMPPPGGRHGSCCSEICFRLLTFVKAEQLGYVTANDTGFYVERNPDSVLGPDIAFWSKDRLSEMPEGYIEIAPDLAVEVVSPNDAHSKLQLKVNKYLQSGVKLIWLVDPELRIVTTYRGKDQIRILEENDVISADEVLPGFTCGVNEFFS